MSVFPHKARASRPRRAPEFKAMLADILTRQNPSGSALGINGAANRAPSHQPIASIFSASSAQRTDAASFHPAIAARLLTLGQSI